MTLKTTIQKMLDNGYQLKSDDVINFKIRNYDANVSELKLPTRAEHTVLRNKIETIGELIDYFSRGTERLKGIGAKTIKETKLAILEWNWGNMNEKERAAYLQELFV